MSREGADARLARLLAIVPWIASHDGPSLEEVSRRFSVTEKDLLADLNLLFMCGVYPFTPDVLIDVHIADGRVWISMADYFRRPLRLNAQEGLALVSAGRAFLAFPDAGAAGPLASALEKLDSVLGLAGGDGLEVELADVDPDVVSALRQAAEDHQKMHMQYYSYGRDRRTSRVIHPWRVFNQAGEWYLEAWCENVDAARTFRLDRIEALRPTGDGFDPGEPDRRRRSSRAEGLGAEEVSAAGAAGNPLGAAAAGSAVFHPQADDLVWVLDLDPPAHWIAEQYPNESVEERPGGVLRVRLRAARAAWLERLLLRAGPHARIAAGETGVGRAAAARILARYRA